MYNNTMITVWIILTCCVTSPHSTYHLLLPWLQYHHRMLVPYNVSIGYPILLRVSQLVAALYCNM